MTEVAVGRLSDRQVHRDAVAHVFRGCLRNISPHQGKEINERSSNAEEHFAIVPIKKRTEHSKDGKVSQKKVTDALPPVKGMRVVLVTDRALMRQRVPCPTILRAAKGLPIEAPKRPPSQSHRVDKKDQVAKLSWSQMKARFEHPLVQLND